MGGSSLGGSGTHFSRQVVARENPEAASAAGADRMARLAAIMSSNIMSAFAPVDNYLEKRATEDKRAALKKQAEDDKRLGREAQRIALDNPSGLDAAIRSKDDNALRALNTLQDADPASSPVFLQTSRKPGAASWPGRISPTLYPSRLKGPITSPATQRKPLRTTLTSR